MKVLGAMGGVALLVAAALVVSWLSNRGIELSGKVSDSTTPKVTDGERNQEGEYLRNPFTKPGGGPAPKLEVTEREYDFGVMKFDPDPDGEGQSHVFIVRNVGDAPLKLARGPSTCQCTMTDLQDQVEVPPGGSTEVTVTWKPTAPADEFSKGASIWTNAPSLFDKTAESGDGKIMFTVKGKVYPAVRVEPSVFSLGTLDETKPTPFTSLVYSQVLDDLEVQIDKTSSEHVSAELRPMTEEELESQQAKSGWAIEGLIEPKLNIGRVSESVSFTTNEPTATDSTLTITAHRQGPVTIAGRYWNNVDTAIDFKTFRAADGRETTLNLYVTRQDEPLELHLIEKHPEILQVTHERDPEFQDPDRERIMIHVKVPPNAPPDRLLGKSAGRMRFGTNRPDIPEIKLYLVYESTE